MKFTAILNNYIFGLANIVFTAITGILFVPLYLKFIDLGTYGAWLALYNVISIITSLESGIALVLTQKLSKSFSENNIEFIKELNGANLVISILISFLFAFIGLLFAPYVVFWVKTPTASISIIIYANYICIAASIFGFLAGQIGLYTQVWLDTFQSGISNLLSSIFGIIIIIVCLNIDYGVLALAYGMLSRALFKFLYLFIYTLKKWNIFKMPMFSFNYSLIKVLILESFMPFLSRISSVVVNNSQVLIVSSYISPIVAVTYDITSKLIVVFSLIMSNLNGSIFSSLTQIFSSNKKSYIKSTLETLYELTNSIYFWTFLFCTLFNRHIVSLWVGVDKYGGFKLNLLIILSVILKERRSLQQLLLFSLGSYSKSSIIDIFSSIIYIALIFILVPVCGIMIIPIALILISIFSIFLYDDVFFKLLDLEKISFYLSGYKIFIGMIASGILIIILPNFESLLADLVIKSLILIFLAIYIQFKFSKVSRDFVHHRLMKRN